MDDTSGTSTWLRRLRGVLLLVCVVALTLAIKGLIVQAFYIPDRSGSMQPTLEPGSRVLVDKVTYRFRDVERGDIIVFDTRGSFAGDSVPADVGTHLRELVGAAVPGRTDYIKRVIGVGGDRVVCCDSQGRITVNGTPLTEPYVYGGDAASDVPFDVVVPDGHVFVLGDHRSASSDSRAHLDEASGGMVPVDRIVGRAFFTVWPTPEAGPLERPATFDAVPAPKRAAAQ